MAKTKSNNRRPVLVTTKHRGVFFGYAADTSGETVRLTGARCAIKFGTTRGFMQLASTGPTEDSKIGSSADIELRDVTSVSDVTPEAEKKWLQAS